MAAPKKDSDKTPTELFSDRRDKKAADENAAKYPPNKPTAIDPNTGMVYQPTLVLGVPGGGSTAAGGSSVTPVKEPTIGERFVQGMRSSGKGLDQWRSDHPLGNWALNLPGYVSSAAGAIPAAGGFAGSLIAPNKLPPPTGSQTAPAATTTPATTAQPANTNGQQQPANDNGDGLDSLLKPHVVPTGGGGGGARKGLGSDAAVQGAQRDEIENKQGYANKKMEEGEAHLKVLDINATLTQQLGDLQKKFAITEKTISDQVDSEEEATRVKMADFNKQAAAKGVDPGRLFRNPSTGFQLIMAAGGAMGGILQAMQHGGSNIFIDHVNKLVQEDIKAQEVDIAQGWRQSQAMETEYQHLVRSGVDKKVAAGKFYQSVLGAMKTDMQAKLDKARIPEVKANLEAGIIAIEQEVLSLETHYQSHWKDVYDRRAAAAASAAAAERERLLKHTLDVYNARTGRMNAETNRIEAEGKTATAGGANQKDLNERFVPTEKDETGTAVKGFLASTSAEGDRVRKIVAAGANLHRLLDNISAKRNALGGLGRFGAATTPYKAAWERDIDSDTVAIQATIKELDSLGAWDNGVERMMAPRISDFKSIGGAGDVQIQALKQQVTGVTNSWAAATGGAKAARVYSPKHGKSIIVETGETPDAPTKEKTVDREPVK